MHKRATGNTSARVTVFTAEYGLVHAYFKGARTAKKSTLLQPFTPLWLMLDRKGQWIYVRSAELHKPAIPLSGHALFAGLYINELLLYLLPVEESQPAFFHIYQQTLENLAHASERLTLEASLRRFEWQLLATCGYQLSFDLSNDINHYNFIAGHGFVPAENGKLPAEHLHAWAADELDDIEVLRTAKWVMRLALDFVLAGKEVKTRRLFKNVSSSTGHT